LGQGKRGEKALVEWLTVDRLSSGGEKKKKGGRGGGGGDVFRKIPKQKRGIVANFLKCKLGRERIHQRREKRDEMRLQGSNPRIRSQEKGKKKKKEEGGGGEAACMLWRGISFFSAREGGGGEDDFGQGKGRKREGNGEGPAAEAGSGGKRRRGRVDFFFDVGGGGEKKERATCLRGEGGSWRCLRGREEEGKRKLCLDRFRVPQVRKKEGRGREESLLALGKVFDHFARVATGPRKEDRVRISDGGERGGEGRGPFSLTTCL